MSTTTSNGQALTLTANTAASADWPVFFEWIVITNETTSPIYVTTDGTAATSAENGADVILPGAQAMVANRQPKLKNITSQAGSTAQSLLNPTSGHLTAVSVIGSAVGNVVVSPQ
jgi:hypothetical protein